MNNDVEIEDTKQNPSCYYSSFEIILEVLNLFSV